MMAVKGANVVMGHDKNCAQWIKAARNWEDAPKQQVAAAIPEQPDEGPANSTVSRRRMRLLRQASGA